MRNRKTKTHVTIQPSSVGGGLDLSSKPTATNKSTYSTSAAAAESPEASTVAIDTTPYESDGYDIDSTSTIESGTLEGIMIGRGLNSSRTYVVSTAEFTPLVGADLMDTGYLLASIEEGDDTYITQTARLCDLQNTMKEIIGKQAMGYIGVPALIDDLEKLFDALLGSIVDADEPDEYYENINTWTAGWINIGLAQMFSDYIENELGGDVLELVPLMTGIIELLRDSYGTVNGNVLTKLEGGYVAIIAAMRDVFSLGPNNSTNGVMDLTSVVDDSVPDASELLEDTYRQYLTNDDGTGHKERYQSSLDYINACGRLISLIDNVGYALYPKAVDYDVTANSDITYNGSAQPNWKTSADFFLQKGPLLGSMAEASALLPYDIVGDVSGAGEFTSGLFNILVDFQNEDMLVINDGEPVLNTNSTSRDPFRYFSNTVIVASLVKFAYASLKGTDRYLSYTLLEGGSGIQENLDPSMMPACHGNAVRIMLSEIHNYAQGWDNIYSSEPSFRRTNSGDDSYEQSKSRYLSSLPSALYSNIFDVMELYADSKDNLWAWTFRYLCTNMTMHSNINKYDYYTDQYTNGIDSTSQIPGWGVVTSVDLKTSLTNVTRLDYTEYSTAGLWSIINDKKLATWSLGEGESSTDILVLPFERFEVAGLSIQEYIPGKVQYFDKMFSTAANTSGFTSNNTTLDTSAIDQKSQEMNDAVSNFTESSLRMLYGEYSRSLGDADSNPLPHGLRGYGINATLYISVLSALQQEIDDFMDNVASSGAPDPTHYLEWYLFCKASQDPACREITWNLMVLKYLTLATQINDTGQSFMFTDDDPFKDENTAIQSLRTQLISDIKSYLGTTGLKMISTTDSIEEALEQIQEDVLSDVDSSSTTEWWAFPCEDEASYDDLRVYAHGNAPDGDDIRRAQMDIDRGIEDSTAGFIPAAEDYWSSSGEFEPISEWFDTCISDIVTNTASGPLAALTKGYINAQSTIRGGEWYGTYESPSDGVKDAFLASKIDKRNLTTPGQLFELFKSTTSSGGINFLASLGVIFTYCTNEMGPYTTSVRYVAGNTLRVSLSVTPGYYTESAGTDDDGWGGDITSSPVAQRVSPVLEDAEVLNAGKSSFSLNVLGLRACASGIQRLMNEIGTGTYLSWEEYKRMGRISLGPYRDDLAALLLHELTYDKAHNVYDAIAEADIMNLKVYRSLAQIACNLSQKNSALSGEMAGTDSVGVLTDSLKGESISLLPFITRDSVALNKYLLKSSYYPHAQYFHLPSSKAYASKQIRNMIKFFSKAGQGYIEDEFPGRKLIFNVGIPSGMMGELRERMISQTSNLSNINASVIGIRIYKKDMRKPMHKYRSKVYIFDTKKFVMQGSAEPLMFGGYDTLLETHSDMWDAQGVLDNTWIYTFYHDPNSVLGETNIANSFDQHVPSSLGTAYGTGTDGTSGGEAVGMIYEESAGGDMLSYHPDNYKNSYKVSQEVSDDVTYNTVADYYLKMYQKILMGFDYTEDVFPIDTSLVEPGKVDEGKEDVFDVLLTSNLAMLPQASEDLATARTYDRIKHECARSLFFSSERYEKRAMAPKCFDRVFSLLVNERDFERYYPTLIIDNPEAEWALYQGKNYAGAIQHQPAIIDILPTSYAEEIESPTSYYQYYVSIELIPVERLILPDPYGDLDE